jgi:hypothetical protein
MKKYLSFWLLVGVLLGGYPIFAQSNLSGSITDSKNVALQGVSVRVYEPKTKQLLSFAISNIKGLYLVNKVIEQDSVKLVVSMMGYKTQERIIDKNDLKQDFLLSPQAIELKEVIVKTPPIRYTHDTLTYDVKKFANSADRNLGDVLKKLPGIDVEQNGTVKYNGEAINKYYTEGKDLFDGKYKVANDNFRWQDVERIEVLENHQPVKMLTDIQHSSKAGLNVIFKESIKSKWIKKFDAGLGKSTDKFLYDNALSIIRIAKNNQSFSILQNNNIGTDLSFATNTLTMDSFFEVGAFSKMQRNARSLSNLVGLNQPPLNNKFFLFNQAHFSTSKNLWTIKKIYETVLNIEFLDDKQANQGSNETRYFLGKDTVRISEQQDNRWHKNQLEGTLKIVANQPKYYFSNKLIVKGTWQNNEGNILNNSLAEIQTVQQNQQFNRQWVSDELKILKKNEANNIFEIRAWGYYQNAPQSLDILINKQLAEQKTFQDGRVKKSFFNAYTNFLLNKTIKLNVKAGLEYSNQNLTSRLTGFPSPTLIGDSSLGSNNQNLSYWRLFAETGYGIVKERFKLNLNLPVSILYWINPENKRFYIEPKLTISYILSPKFTTNLSYQYNYDLAEIEDFNNSFILSNYRNISRSNGQIPENKNHLGNLSLVFKDAVRFWFINLNLGVGQAQNNIFPIQTSEGIYLKQIKIASDNSIENTTISSDISKYFYEIKTKFTLSVSSQLQQSNRIVSDNQLAKIENQSQVYSFSINSKALNWLQTQFDIKSMNSTNIFKTSIFDNRTEFKKIDLRLVADFIISKRLNFGFEANKYLIENASIQKQDYLFLDCSTTYHFKKNDFEISLYARNLTNEKSFQTLSFLDNSASVTDFNLRPRQILLKFGFKF